jgi:hypothetical protein
MTERQPKIRFQEVAQKAQKMTLEQGRHVPMLMIEGDKEVAVCHIAEVADTAEGRAGQMLMIGEMLANSIPFGVLQQIFFITEGWMSVVDDGKIPDTPPSQDPQRLEVLTVSGLDMRTGETRMKVFEMKRDDDGQLRSLNTPAKLSQNETTQADSPLLTAFVIGFLGLMQEDGDRDDV